ncbi:TIGR03364 family FAD-dependent oxidoreductase [Ascidiimonas aurantiaca]|uniref:TIGR03364 family FAD-dependent oxidoreductase n=1 Tax=Ascidiimonas aurantiaca TaxID=1685432 RepID=UPI0030EF6D1F
MAQKFDIIIIGGGILGTFHAWHALKNGLRVCLVEKDNSPRGATTQNFGQVVPSGMNTKWQKWGRESLDIYKDIQSSFDISVRQNGTVYLASDQEEEQLLRELKNINKTNDYHSVMLTKKECLDRYPGLSKNYVVAGLLYPQEVTVEPRTMIHRLQKYMQETLQLVMKTNFLAVRCEKTNNGVEVTGAHNENIIAEKVIICSGADFKYLYPNLFWESDLQVSKLQMMQTVPQKNYELKGSVLTGWSIRRYESFSECPSYPGIKANESNDSLQKKWGVHILFKQAADGSIIIGDSHQYANAAKADELGYDLNLDIDRFIMKETKKIFEFPTFDIQRKWYGTYAQCKNHDIFQKTIDNHIHIVTGIGGKGMTGSAGFARHHIGNLLNLN